MTVKLVWATSDAEKQILYMTRVSSPHQDSNDTRLLKYLINHQHWSPFEMANMCVEVITSRDVSAQILRHRSFTFQEFSQRYAKVVDIVSTEPRRQDDKNRQSSHDDLDAETKNWWMQVSTDIEERAKTYYQIALNKGIAKESARRILPMAIETKLYMNGTLRSWIHYFSVRCTPETQLEHREIALQIREVFSQQFPVIAEVLYE